MIPTGNQIAQADEVVLISALKTQSVLMAESLEDGCPKALPVVSYETQRYFVHICKGQDGSLFYRGVNKHNGEAINVPDVEIEPGEGFSARNGNVLYRVDNQALVVYQGDKLILQDAVLRVVEGR